MSYYPISNIDEEDIYFDFDKLRFTIGRIDNIEKNQKQYIG